MQVFMPLHHESGASLMEVLVALALLTLVIIGVIGMQAAALAGNYDAYYRSQATISAQDLTERARSWRNSAGSFANNRGESALACTSSSLLITSATADRNDWLGQLGCQLPHAQARIVLDGSYLTVEIFWRPSTRLTRTESSLLYVTQL